MYLRSDSAAGVRFLAAVKEGRGLKPSARAAGIGMATGYRWLRESFVALRGQGLSVEAAQAELGFCSPLMLEWEEQRLARPREGRHHLAVGADVEDAFWRCFLAGGRLDAALRAAGGSRATGYRWWRARFLARREQGLTVRAAARELRVPPARARRWEDERRKAAERASRERDAAGRRAVLGSARHAELLMAGRAPRSDVQARDTRYWQLMRSGLTNTAACMILGVNRRTGGLIRARYRQQSAVPARTIERTGLTRRRSRRSCVPDVDVRGSLRGCLRFSARSAMSLEKTTPGAATLWTAVRICPLAITEETLTVIAESDGACGLPGEDLAVPDPAMPFRSFVVRCGKPLAVDMGCRTGLEGGAGWTVVASLPHSGGLIHTER
jgi:hypothetical protein